MKTLPVSFYYGGRVAPFRPMKRPYFSEGSAFKIYLRLFRILRRSLDVSTARREVRGHILSTRAEHVRHLMGGAK